MAATFPRGIRIKRKCNHDRGGSCANQSVSCILTQEIKQGCQLECQLRATISTTSLRFHVSMYTWKFVSKDARRTRRDALRDLVHLSTYCFSANCEATPCSRPDDSRVPQTPRKFVSRDIKCNHRIRKHRVHPESVITNK